MPAGRGEEERFAAGVEYGSIPGSLGAGDEDLARELELVALLRSAGPALSPTPAARSRAKDRLMAAFAAQHAGQHTAQHFSAEHSADTGPLAVIAPVAPAPPEHRAEPTPLRPRHAGRHSMPEADADHSADAANAADAPEAADVAQAELGEVRPMRRRRERPGHSRAAVLGAVAAASLIALATTGISASQDALPGDSLYQVKRVAETTGYALTFGEQAKARRHLEQAQRRLDEVEGMVTRDQAARASGAQVDPADQELVRSTMQEFDTDANEGSRRLLAEEGDPAQADDVREWATQQSERLSGLRSTMPAQDKADESLALLDRLLDEAAAQGGCDPALGSCSTLVDGDPLDGVTGTVVPETIVPGTSEPRTTARGDGDDPADDTDDVPADDEQPSGSSDDGSRDGGDGDRDRSGGSDGSGGSGGGGATGGSGDLSVPLPLPAPVRVPSVGGLPGVSVG